MTSIRNASKKAGSATKNKHSPGRKFVGLKKYDGDNVFRYDLLATQPRMRWHPGLNVSKSNKNLPVTKWSP